MEMEMAMRTRKRSIAGSESVPDYVTTRQAAKLCGVSIFSVQRWFDEGLLHGSTLPGGWRRIALSSLNTFMRKHTIIPSTGDQAHLHRVLLVDNNAKLLSIMKDALVSVGKYRVQTAATGLEAGMAMMEFKPDSVILDVMLEDVPGAQIVRRIRESQVGRSIRIVAISGRAADADKGEILAAGADAYFKKPFAMAELIKALEGRRTVRARK